MNLPELAAVLDKIGFFERERTGCRFVDLVILLYDFGVSLRNGERILGWIGVKRSHVVIWTWWIQKFGQRLGEAGRRRSQVFGMCISNRRTVADNAAIDREIMARARSTQSQEHPLSIPSYFV